MSKQRSPAVPVQIENLVTDEVLDVHERWQHVSLAKVHSKMGQPAFVGEPGNKVGVVTLSPDGDIDDTHSLGLVLSGGWNPASYIRAEILRQIVHPNGRLDVFPQNTNKNKYYHLSAEELEAMIDYADDRPLAQRRIQVLEKLLRSQIKLTGFGRGANAVISMGGIASGLIEISHINADELISAEDRNKKQAKRDLRQSGGIRDKLAAVNDAALPVLKDARGFKDLSKEYLCNVFSDYTAENETSFEMIRGSKLDEIERDFQITPALILKIGQIAGSFVMQDRFNDKNYYPWRYRSIYQIQYSGKGTQGHATDENPFSHALMALDGFNRKI